MVRRASDEGATPMKILYIPDTQAAPGQDFAFLRCIGQYIVNKQPDVIVHAGDFADMPSLSSYDKGKKSFEGRRYRADIEAAHQAMEALLGPMREYNLKAIENKKKCYRPRMVLTLGNHEERILRAINLQPELDGTYSIDDLKYKEYGWEVYDFQEVVVIEGIAFSHFFITGTKGQAAGTAAAQLNKKHMSCIAGHQQGRQCATAYRADGKQITSIIAGSCYEEPQGYLGPQGNKHWHGVLMLHNVHDGEFDECWVPLHYLKAKYTA